MRLRLLVDRTGEDVCLNTNREPTAILRDAVQVMRRVNREQKVFNLCLHLTDDTLTMHWYSSDEKFATVITHCAETIQRSMVAVLKGGDA